MEMAAKKLGDRSLLRSLVSFHAWFTTTGRGGHTATAWEQMLEQQASTSGCKTPSLCWALEALMCLLMPLIAFLTFMNTTGMDDSQAPEIA
jgi:hypothetical protein